MNRHRIDISLIEGDLITSGDGQFVITKNDGLFQKGDRITFGLLNDGGGMTTNHPVKNGEYEISCVISGHGLRRNYVALGLKEILHWD